MKRFNRIAMGVLLAGVALMAAPGCGEKNAAKAGDPIIQGYMQQRSDLAAQRRRLVTTYGADSPTVAQVDQQIKLVDEAMIQRRQQVIEQETGRREMQRMKAETESMPLPTASEPAP